MFIDNKKALKNFCLRTKKLFGCRVVHQVLIEFIKSLCPFFYYHLNIKTIK